MDDYKVSELKELSKEELVSIILRDRQELTDLKEKLGLMRADKFGSKSEALLSVSDQVEISI